MSPNSPLFIAMAQFENLDWAHEAQNELKEVFFNLSIDLVHRSNSSDHLLIIEGSKTYVENAITYLIENSRASWSCLLRTEQTYPMGCSFNLNPWEGDWFFAKSYAKALSSKEIYEIYHQRKKDFEGLENDGPS